MFIAKNNDLIILIKETREELEQALQFMVYTSIEETTKKYELYNGEYLTEEEVIELRKAQFNKNFFPTSLGYIRRKVSMATGEIKDFLSDLLPTISMGVQMGNPIEIITYNKPDFTQEVTDWTSLQNAKTVTMEFVKECFIQLSNDFKPVNSEEITNTIGVSNEIDTTASERGEIDKDSIE